MERVYQLKWLINYQYDAQGKIKGVWDDREERGEIKTERFPKKLESNGFRQRKKEPFGTGPYLGVDENQL